MAKYTPENVSRLKRYVDDLNNSNLKWKTPIELNKLSKLMQKVGFEGPLNKKGNVRGFKHELLKGDLTNGQFTVHELSQKKRKPSISYYDFKNFVYPHVSHVLNIIEEQGLIEQQEPTEESKTDAQF